MTLNVKNLKKLADGLMTIPEDQFNLATFQSVTDGEKFSEVHPTLAKRELKSLNVNGADWLRGDLLESLSPHFQIKHGCGTSGCALGWAPTLVKRGHKDEDWDDYSLRVFGTCRNYVKTYEWNYMFSPDWSDKENTPKATAARIMYVVENGKAPDDWTFYDSRLDVELEAV